MARGPVYICAVLSYSLAYTAADAMNNDNLVTALSAQIQISIAMIKDEALPLRKLRRPSKPQHRETLGLGSTLHCCNDSGQMIGILIIDAWHILYSQT